MPFCGITRIILFQMFPFTFLLSLSLSSSRGLDICLSSPLLFWGTVWSTLSNLNLRQSLMTPLGPGDTQRSVTKQRVFTSAKRHESATTSQNSIEGNNSLNPPSFASSCNRLSCDVADLCDLRALRPLLEWWQTSFGKPATHRVDNSVFATWTMFSLA